MKLSTLLVGLGLAASTFLATASISQASTLLIDQGDTTFDTATHLQWLDLTKTLGLSVNDVLGGAGGYVAAGYRYATTTEVVQLWHDLGFEDKVGYGHDGNPPVPSGIPTFFKLFTGFDGSISPGSIQEVAGIAFHPGLDPRSDYLWSEIVYYQDPGEDPRGGGTSDYQLAFLDQSNPGWGSFLVRDNVAVTPLPAALPLFAAATGLMGLVGWRRRASSQA